MTNDDRPYLCRCEECSAVFAWRPNFGKRPSRCERCTEAGIDDMHNLVMGGQGRSNGSVRSDARVVFTLLLIAAILACALIGGGK